MREAGRGPGGNVRHGGERFWRSAAVLQRPWGSGAKLGTTVGRVVVKRGRRLRGREGWVIVQLTGASRSDRSQLDFYTFVAFRPSLIPPLPYDSCTYRPRPHDSLSAALQANSTSCDPSQPPTCARCYSTFVPDQYVINVLRYTRSDIPGVP
jgi:hypothetical protein